MRYVTFFFRLSANAPPIRGRLAAYYDRTVTLCSSDFCEPETSGCREELTDNRLTVKNVCAFDALFCSIAPRKIFDEISRLTFTYIF